MSQNNSPVLLPFGIHITLDGKGSGNIHSDLRAALTSDEDSSTGRRLTLASCDAVESLLLALACAGVNLSTPAACAAVNASIEAIGQSLFDKGRPTSRPSVVRTK